MRNLANSLLTIPLVSLSLLSLNFASSAFANTNQINHVQTNETLIAQAASCNVSNIQTGQLAIRFTPNGKSKAGLNNGNTVTLLRNGSTPWVYVRVTNGPNSRVNGLEGWVNSNYLNCSNIAAKPQILCDVTNIKTGQLALRFHPNGKSKAGLNNGNVVKWITETTSPWVYVRVVEGPNRKVTGLEGWVNSNFLACYDDA
ncbi:hypothetical protein RIVM261_013440 [Rivularia sp. IAM M-261]|nr:hypothetical protein RIVM261_013440 [Rivularia sp. IAM M-261]